MRRPKAFGGRVCFLVAASIAASALPAGAQTIFDVLGTRGDRLASAIRPAGDFDRDGYPDVLVGADQLSKDTALPTYTSGLVAILSGRGGQLLFKVTGADLATATGQAVMRFGQDAAMVGDFDRDGVCDVLAVHGSPKVLRKIAAFSGATRALLFEVTDPYGHTDFGDQIVALGDLLDQFGNLAPDGVPDFAVGAPNNPVSTVPVTYPGYVYVYSGATASVGPVLSVPGVYPRIGFGTAISLVSDLDGDGLPALAVSAPGGGYVDFLDGPGFVSYYVLTTPLLTGALFGLTMANLGDFDGDGRTELAIGAPSAKDGRGRVFVYSLDPLAAAPVQRVRLDPDLASPGTQFGLSLPELPVDPLTGRGLLDLDSDGNPDPFLDWNRDGKPDYVIGAPGYADFLGAPSQSGGVYLVRGTGAAQELAREPLHQGPDVPDVYAYLPLRVPDPGDAFGLRLALLGNPLGESQLRLASGSSRDESNRGGLAVLRPQMLHFDDDSFTLATDVVGTSRKLKLDFGPRHAGQRFRLLGTTAGANPGQVYQGAAIPLNRDATGGLWDRTVSGSAAGAPLSFSALTGVLDAAGQATISLQVTANPVGHPWFSVLRQHYTAVLIKRGQPGVIAMVSAPVALDIF